jgi:hypothetical protein
MLLISLYNGVFLLPASRMLSTGRAGEPSSAKLMLSNMFIAFYLCNLIIQDVNDEDFILFILSFKFM